MHKFFRLPRHVVAIPVIGLFVLIYLITVSHWAAIAYLVGVTVILWFVWMKKQKEKKRLRSPL
jgi:O-antigen/teichoic acid export membrane protein